MFQKLMSSLLGTKFQREMKKLRPLVEEIHRQEERLEDFSEEQLQGQTDRFRQQIQEARGQQVQELQELGEQKAREEDPGERRRLNEQMSQLQDQIQEVEEEVLDDLLPEAFATVRETCRRLLGHEFEVTGQEMTWDMVPYDVQLIGGIVLHQGRVAEMKTGEGKTLVATMPLYLNALLGHGAHLVTVNEYLARRDAQWMRPVYEYLGMSVACVDDTSPSSEERRQAYGADITYGTNNQFGFDYLRDNMVVDLDQRVQRGHPYVIIDEVDSVLIDEARTPLIISGPAAQEGGEVYEKYNRQVRKLVQQQKQHIRQMVSQAEELLEKEQEMQAGELLLAATRGDPNNKRLQKVKQQKGVEQLIQDVENELRRLNRLHEIDDDLLYSIDEASQTVQINDAGHEVLSPNDPEAFVVPDISEAAGRLEEDDELSSEEKQNRMAELEEEYAEKSERMHVVHQLVRAYALFEKDVEYVVENGQVVIVDEFTGRKMPSRRWSDGLHQAVEAKEGMRVQGETQTLATITIQNYFRMYDKMSGMTGTAETEEGEFMEIYDMDVVAVPTHRPLRRVDHDDLIYRTRREKYNAVLEEVQRLHHRGLPILVGTTSVDVSEKLSRMMKRQGLDHQVLNAKNHERESKIVARAGQPGSITIATNMAGRGTDIKLGKGVQKCAVCGIQEQGEGAFAQEEDTPDLNRDQIEELGCETDPPCGLQIIGTERHEARRIDRQLRGRSGRQGEPGASRFFLSLEDDLMRLFGSEKIAKVMDTLGAEEGEVITHPFITRQIERAQEKVENKNFEIRKQLLDYDDVMNQQREVIYDLRLFALEESRELKGEIWEMLLDVLQKDLEEFIPSGSQPERWDLSGLKYQMLMDYFLLVDFLPDEDMPTQELAEIQASEIHQQVRDYVREAYQQKIDDFGEHWEAVLSRITLSVIDQQWKAHLYDLDQLQDTIQYRSWGQRDPVVEYKKEAFQMFEDLMDDIHRSIANLLFRARLTRDRTELQAPEVTGVSGPDNTPNLGVHMGGDQQAGFDPQAQARQQDQQQKRVIRPDQPLEVEEEPGRNDPCPCGSGKKYKKCHGHPARQ